MDDKIKNIDEIFSDYDRLLILLDNAITSGDIDNIWGKVVNDEDGEYSACRDASSGFQDQCGRG
mgnify:CR=1 FL=1